MIIRLYLTARDQLVLWAYLCETCGRRRGDDWWASSRVAPLEGDCNDCGAPQELPDLFQTEGEP